MMMLWKSMNEDGRGRALFLVLVMLLSTTAANLVSASTSRTYTTDTDPVDVALGDFDCDGDLDIVTANDRSTKFQYYGTKMDISRSVLISGHQVTLAKMQISKTIPILSKLKSVNSPVTTQLTSLSMRNRPLRQDATGAIVSTSQVT